MILNLHVKNLALISEVEVDFREGLNILTGETGAGKSMIIGSINMALGAKSDKEMIRTGAEYALVELTFSLETGEQREILKEMDLPVEEGDIIVLQRKIMPNRSVCKVCGETVTNAQLKELAPYFLDVYGQHDHQTLLQTQKHLEILDSFGTEELQTEKQHVNEQYRQYREAVAVMQELSMDQNKRDKELALSEFELQEIEKAELKPEEDARLESDFNRLQNAFKIKENVFMSLNLLRDKEDNCLEQLGRALKELYAAQNHDEQLREYVQEAEEIENLMQDFLRDIQGYADRLDFSQEDFDQMQFRLDCINHLKDKYGFSIEIILKYAEELKQKIDQLQNLDENRLIAKKRLDNAEENLRLSCAKLSSLRKSEAVKLEKEIQNALEDLNFNNAQFHISFTDKGELSHNGYDKVEFLVSTNLGEPVKPLAHVASGGELSRIMLAIKTVSAKRDAINTLIFDEIDTGISGKTAWKVSEKLGMLAKNHQIICITHLPQIAAMADSHYVIEKEVLDGITQTSIRELSNSDMMTEVARLIGGETITDSAMEHARELKELALNTKII